MKFVLDENIPLRASLYLTGSGHEVTEIRLTDKQGACDEEIFILAQELNAVFITTDRDFFHTIPFLFDHHCGVIVISLRQPNGEAILSRIKWAISNIDKSSLDNKVILLKDSGYKVYG